MKKPLTPKQKIALGFISKFSVKNGYPPSLQEIAGFLNKSLSTAQHFVEELKLKGYLHKEKSVARGISPTNASSGKIFLLGNIAAGKPIEPIENPEPVEVPLSMTRSPGEYYALRAKGNSMIEDNIQDNDVIVVKHQKTAQNGDTVVAITEDGATLKIFRKKNGRVYLEPRNKRLKNIYPKQLDIRGKFCGLIRKETR